ncbi:AAA family ATPase, partial [candidate division WOR-3 bacterium]|nr:AAA family ATPase [candidate division WOR-3 bacterium]MBD3365108.1 AAA family ATPase [candidate division WOR-3 bacterium]
MNSKSSVEGLPLKSHLDVTRSLAFSSPAGSGKTQKLAQRYVALLVSGVSPERILAITFTEKAAAEMKERVIEILRRSYPALYEEIRPKLARFRISTVHSFARSVLERFAFDHNLTPNFQIIDAVSAELLREEVVREGLLELGSEDSDLALWVRHLTLTEGWTGLLSKVSYLFKHIPQSYLAVNSAPAALDKTYLTAWHELKTSWGPEFWDASGFSALPEPTGHREHLRAVRTHLEAFSSRFLTQKCTLYKRIPKSIDDRSGFIKKGEAFYRYYRIYGLWDARIQTEGFLKVFRHLANLYHERKQRDKVLDFADLEYKLYRVLYFSGNWSNILASFDEQTDHILLDEFQDTNGLQWAIVSKLVEEWRSGMGAKTELGKVPTLFIVGDEKQSIYLFRGANVEVFRRANREMKAWMGDAFDEVTVKENYRSLPNIVEFINALFSKLMTGGDEDWKTSYDRFLPLRNPEEGLGHVEILLTKMDEKKLMVERKEAEAETVAARISEIIGSLKVFDKVNGNEEARSCEYGDITVLLRRRTHLEEYERAFQNHRIPFVVVQGTGFHSSPEIILLRQLVRTLANPKDTTALYGVLKSALCGFSEDEICKITFTNEGGDFWERFVNSPISKQARA